jgi:hypothetical protein
MAFSAIDQKWSSMNTTRNGTDMDAMKVKLSTLWVFLLFNMMFADIFTFMNPGFLNGLIAGYAEQVQISEVFLLVAAMVTEIPIAMVLLSRVLNHRANRRANIIAAIITIVFVIGGGSATLHYIFFATIEVVCSLFIVGYAWNWPDLSEQASREEKNFAS